MDNPDQSTKWAAPMSGASPVTESEKGATVKKDLVRPVLYLGTKNYYLITDEGEYFTGFYDNDPLFGPWSDAKPFATLELAQAQALLLNEGA